MSRSNYTDEGGHPELYRATVERTIKGKRGQAFLCEMAAAMDAMPDKKLITDELIDESGMVCPIGAVCKARGLDVSDIDESEPIEVAQAVGISTTLAAEIAYMNDEYFDRRATPEQRWQMMRNWIHVHIQKVVSP